MRPASLKLVHLNALDGSIITGRAATRDEAMAAFRAAWNARQKATG